MGSTGASGDADRVERAYREHASAVFDVASHIGGRDLAAEVTQEVFLRFWRRPDKFDPQRGSLGAFLMVMTRGITIDMLRANAARRAREDRTPLVAVAPALPEGEAVRHALQSEGSRRMRAALQHLRSNERDAIVLAFYGGLTYKEVAVALHAPEGTVKSRIRSGLRRLALYVEAHDLEAFAVESA
jgi:RNA polymerase sigma-70 factor (ECF subfamily)